MRRTAAGPAQPTRRIRPSIRPRRGMAMAGIGVLLLVAGCSGGSSSAGGQVSGTVTIAAVPGVDNVPLFLAEHDGYFQAAGLHVQIRKYASVPAEVQALTSGHVDIAAGDYGPFLFAEAQQKAQIKIIADGYDATAGVLEVLTLPGSGINSPQALGNKKIGAPNSADLTEPPGTPDSLETAATTSVLQSYGVDMATVTFQQMTQSAEITALHTHQVSAILVTEPYIYQAESQLGAVEVLDACSGATAGLPLSGYFTMGVWSRQNKTALADFKSALGQAQAKAAMSGPVQSVLPSYTGITPQEAAVVTVGSYPASTNALDLTRVSELMDGLGMFSNPVAIGKEILH